MLTHTKGTDTTTYTYDDIGQLLTENRTGYSASYTYDANGNRASRTVGGVTETFHNDAGDKLTHITIGGNTVNSFTYDAAGRTTRVTVGANQTDLTYDFESRITQITGPGISASYSYNGLDTRISKTENSVSNTFRRAGAYVTDPVLGDGSATFTPGVSERRGSTTTYAHHGLKNMEAQSQSGQTLSGTRQYDAFGNVTSGSGWQGPFGYAGGFGYQEDASGLRLLGHRYYDASTGRFLTRDPIKDGRNWYAYGAGETNPISGFDADGLTWEKVADGYWIRIDMNQQPNPNAHFIRPNGVSTAIEQNGDIRPTHGGKPNPPLDKTDRKVLRKWGGMWGVVSEMLRKSTKVLIIGTLISQGPKAAARDLVFADEVEALGGSLWGVISEGLNNLTGGIRRGLHYHRQERWLGD